MEWKREGFTICDRRDDMDIDTIHRFLYDTYWAKGIPRAVVKKALDHSLCFGLFYKAKQIGFGRVISDRTTFAYLADVFVLPEYRGRGLGNWLVACILSHPHLKGLRRWMLATLDAHPLYSKYGFTALKDPQKFMEINKPGVYQDDP